MRLQRLQQVAVALLDQPLVAPAERAGDFSASSTPVVDPLSKVPFPNNRIPPNRIDPVGLGLVNLYPMPNNADPARNYVNAPLRVCEERDVKGLYLRARHGEIKDVTGIHHSYEPPLMPDVECRTADETIDESASKVLACIRQLI